MSETTLKEKTAKGFAWGALNNGATQLLNAVFGILLSRKLGQEDYGLINMLIIFSLIATALQDSGFVIALTNKKDATHRDYNSVFWFNVPVSICLYALLFFCAPAIADFYGEPILTPLARYYFLGFLISSFGIVPRAVLFKSLKQKELAIMGLTSLVISGAVGITMAYSGMAFWSIATQNATFILCTVVLSWILSGWRPNLDISMEPVRQMFGFSSRMLVTYIFNNINNNVFSLVLGRLYGKYETGVYSQANKWNTMGSNTINGMVQGVAQPTFVQVGDDKEHLCRAFSKMLRFTCFVSFPSMFGLALIAPEFIVVTVTEKWLSSAMLMQILCIGGAFLPLSTLYFNMLISRGKSNIYMWNVIGQGCTILTSILLVHALGGGITHMVCAYVAVVVGWLFVWQYFVRAEIGFSFVQALRDIIPFVIISSVSMLVTYFLTSAVTNIYALLVARILVAAVLYVGIMWLLRANILNECVRYILKK